MRLQKGFVAACCLVATTLWTPAQVVAQAYPTKTVQIIVSYPPGGSGDLMARVIAERMTSLWGQQVIVINKPGAAGMIGAAAAAKSPPRLRDLSVHVGDRGEPEPVLDDDSMIRYATCRPSRCRASPLRGGEPIASSARCRDPAPREHVRRPHFCFVGGRRSGVSRHGALMSSAGEAPQRPL
jgi:hypothetical protein